MRDPSVHFAKLTGNEEPLTDGGRPEGLPYGTAYVEQVGDDLVLHDPAAAALAELVNENNRQATLNNFETILADNADRIAHFKERMTIRGFSPEDYVIIILNVDDDNGSVMANTIMPGHDWQEYRNRGETPFARGLADREWVAGCLKIIDPAIHKEIEESKDTTLVVVVDRDTAIVRPA